MRGVIRSRRERGAAAVEFALVAPVLFLLLFGIIDYGMYFADALSVRQAAAESARMGSVWSRDDTVTPPWGATVPASCKPWDSSTPAPSTELTTLGCVAAASVHPLSGTVYVKVEVLSPDQLTAAAPVPLTGSADWAVPNAVRVCLLEVHTSIIGFLPMPGVITAQASMPLEGTDTLAPTALVGGQQTLPNGLSWSTSCP